ncbi:MAG TPA: cell wall hydrolase [Sphingomicrobium sp.]|nr:cell wall hydrolase [Sphingomicrobium sp.]
MLVLGTGNAAAQTVPAKINYSLKAGAVNAAATPFGSRTTAPIVTAVQRTVSTTTDMFSNAVGAVFGTRQPQTEIAKIAREARWLHNAGWPLYALVDRFSTGAPLGEQANCLATAVYFESRGESLEGQLAVAEVVMNRAASGQYPSTWCDVVKQPWQFSFVRHGQFPAINYNSDAWSKAQGIARLAMANVMRSVPNDVLWYHADYVSPSWGSRLTYVERIGAHLFYRA